MSDQLFNPDDTKIVSPDGSVTTLQSQTEQDVWFYIGFTNQTGKLYFLSPPLFSEMLAVIEGLKPNIRAQFPEATAFEILITIDKDGFGVQSTPRLKEDYLPTVDGAVQ